MKGLKPAFGKDVDNIHQLSEVYAHMIGGVRLNLIVLLQVTISGHNAASAHSFYKERVSFTIYFFPKVSS